LSSPLVLVVEDEPDIANLIEFHVSRAGYRTSVAASGRDALKAAERELPDLVMLDIMLPDVDGLTVCRKLKSGETTGEVPIIFVSAKGEEADVVSGLELGADDYVTKPFSPKVLLARIGAVMRRTQPEEVAERPLLVSGRLTLDPDRHLVKVDGAVIDLTLTQYRILDYLATRPGFVRTRRQIVSAVHGDGTVLSGRAIDVHVAGLRKALGDLAAAIETVRGVGYRLREDALE
jgi:two-component system phosphate regulon response regulator PhoB